MYTEKQKEKIVCGYEQVSTGNIADAMDHLKIRNGVVTGLFPNGRNQKRSVGFALTIQQMPKKTSVWEKGMVKQRLVINTMTKPYDMLVIDACGRMDVCSGGSLLALRAKMRGVRGFVVNGCLRDLGDIEKMGFPVYIKGGSPAASGRILETVGINCPVAIGGVQICPEDLIVCDETGCIVVPKENIESVLKTARIIRKQEEKAEVLLMQGLEFEEARATGIRENPFEEP